MDLETQIEVLRNRVLALSRRLDDQIVRATHIEQSSRVLINVMRSDCSEARSTAEALAGVRDQIRKADVLDDGALLWDAFPEAMDRAMNDD